jgi:hypothetical protein
MLVTRRRDLAPAGAIESVDVYNLLLRHLGVRS